MRLMLDTHTLIWWWAQSKQLPDQIVALITDPDNELLISSAVAWEAATKVRIGKLAAFAYAIPMFDSLVETHGFTPLPVLQNHALCAGTMAGEHRDPFDRMLAAQSIIEGVPILSSDQKLDAFGCQRIWS